MTDTQILNEFKNNIIDFLDELIEQFPSETDLVIGRIFLKDRISSEKLMSNFIQYIVPYREKIEKEDDVFFMEHAGAIMGQSDASSKLNHFKMIWKSSKLGPDDRKTIWAWFKAFLYLADQYVASRK